MFFKELLDYRISRHSGRRQIQRKGPEPIHGKIHTITHENASVFKGISNNIKATRYHSLIVEDETLPKELAVTARSEDNIIMGLMHKTKPIHSVQFHPESYATEHGHEMLKNFLGFAGLA